MLVVRWFFVLFFFLVLTNVTEIVNYQFIGRLAIDDGMGGVVYHDIINFVNSMQCQRNICELKRGCEMMGWVGRR